MKLKPIHKECIQLMVYGNMTYLQIAEQLQCNNNTITLWLKDKDFQEELQSEIRRKFRSLAVKATKKLDELIDSENENVALGAVKETLSKAGFDAIQKVENTNTNIVVSIDDENA